MTRWVSWEEYIKLSPKEQETVTVVTFTGLHDCGTLGVDQRAGGNSKPEDEDESS